MHFTQLSCYQLRALADLPTPTQITMEQFHFNHSLKNIPTSTKQQYRAAMGPKVESFLNRFRWFLYMSLAKLEPQAKETYGFPTSTPPPYVKEMIPFQEDFTKMIKNIEHRHTNDHFQANLKNTVKDIKRTDKIIITADKTRNLYTMPTEEYKKTLTNNVTSNYKKARETEVTRTNKNAANIAQELGIADRVDEFTRPPPFITIKDHKESFPGTKSYRLINPAKSNMGKVSKSILQNAVKNIRKKTGANLWTNTRDVIEWFNKIENKGNLNWMKFDIEQFYPSISKEMFNKTIDWAKNHHNFTDLELRTIYNVKESFLFLDNQPWRKKTTDNFDIAMGSYDGAECAELVGLFILNKIRDIIPHKHVGLYRDDGLAVLPGTQSEIERIKKRLHNLFKSFGLKIEVTAGMKVTDFLDIKLDLTTSTHRPHMKDNNQPIYINRKSNHPPNIKRQLPEMIGKRLSSLSSNQLIFEREKIPYQQALHAAGYKTNLDYSPPPPTTTGREGKKTRSRKVIYFNPPYCHSVKTNVGKKFLALIDKHFGDSPLKKFINRSTVKISYSTMPNIASIISKHNKKMLNKQPEPTEGAEIRTCNCNSRDTCPQNNNCLQKSVIYQAEVKHGNNRATYIGLTGGEFKTRLYQHRHDFKTRSRENATKLSKYVWEQADKGIDVRDKIKWSYIAKAPSYNTATRTCQLCTREKIEILYSEDQDLLNKRTEIGNKCIHKKWHTLSTYLDGRSNAENSQPN